MATHRLCSNSLSIASPSLGTTTLSKQPDTAMPKQRILITGGAGFIGSRLIECLLPRAQVAVFDNLSVGLPMPAARPGLTLRRGDIRNPGEVNQILRDFAPDTVVHLAALHHIPSCEADPRLAVEINILGLQTVLDACAQHGCKRVLLASSGAVYAVAERPLQEDMPLHPADVYAASKLSNEHQLALWAERTDACGISARLFNAIGWGDPNGHLIPEVLARMGDALPGEQVTLAMGNLHTRRDFVDAQDLAEGLAALLQNAPWTARQAPSYNLCSGKETAITEIVYGLADCLGLTVQIHSDPALRRKVDRPSQWGDPQKTALATGWRASIPLNESLARIVTGWQAQQG